MADRLPASGQGRTKPKRRTRLGQQLPGLLNRQLLGFALVRVVAVDRRSNSLTGSTTEKAAAGPKPGRLRPRTADYFTLAKVSGFQGSLARRNASGGVAQALFDHLRAQGYPIPAGAKVDPALEVSLIQNKLDWRRGA